ncbi:MAG: hypothetical protein AAGK04_05095 [Planctomycetota bacterium]
MQNVTPITPKGQPTHETDDDELERLIAAVGDRLLQGFSPVVSALAATEARPNQLAHRLGVDKVLASRLLKAMRTTDPVSAVHRMPGPDPLRRLLKASARAGVDEALIEEANTAVDRFESLIRDDVGDRGTLEAIISAWIPEARREFELRRKQAAYRALSQLRGAHCNAISATVMLRPSDDGDKIDVVWLNGLLGLQRARPNAGAKIATRRFSGDGPGRAPRTLDGNPVDGLEGLLLPEFCSRPLPEVHAEAVGEVAHYLLGGRRYGPNSSVDVMFAELNRGEIDRYVPAESDRKRFAFAEVSTSARVMQFDAFVHRDLGGSSVPSIDLYDTAFEGAASVNDRKRDVDRLSLLETVEPLGWGLSSVRSPDVPRYTDAIAHVFQQVGWNADDFHAFRCRSEYPLYGSQVTLSWQPQTR